jgi:hypothetical protein
MISPKLFLKLLRTLLSISYIDIVTINSQHVAGISQLPTRFRPEKLRIYSLVPEKIKDFSPTRSALGRSQGPVHRGSFSGVKRSGREPNHLPHPVLKLTNCGVFPPPPHILSCCEHGQFFLHFISVHYIYFNLKCRTIIRYCSFTFKS